MASAKGLSGPQSIPGLARLIPMLLRRSVVGAASVVTDIGALWTDALPAASLADTVMAYAVEAARPDTVRLVPVRFEYRVPFRNTSYDATPMLSVDAAQESVKEFEVVPDEVRPVGTEGFTVSRAPMESLRLSMMP
jgi:hypothetical protein